MYVLSIGCGQMKFPGNLMGAIQSNYLPNNTQQHILKEEQDIISKVLD